MMQFVVYFLWNGILFMEDFHKKYNFYTYSLDFAFVEIQIGSLIHCLVPCDATNVTVHQNINQLLI